MNRKAIKLLDNIPNFFAESPDKDGVFYQEFGTEVDDLLFADNFAKRLKEILGKSVEIQVRNGKVIMDLSKCMSAV